MRMLTKRINSPADKKNLLGPAKAEVVDGKIKKKLEVDEVKKMLNAEENFEIILERRQAERLKQYTPSQLKRRTKLLDDIWKAQDKFVDEMDKYGIEHYSSIERLSNRKIQKKLQDLEKKRDSIADEIRETYGEDVLGLHPSDYEGLDIW